MGVGEMGEGVQKVQIFNDEINKSSLVCNVQHADYKIF